MGIELVCQRAAEQHGVVAATEARGLGLTRSAQRHAVNRGRLLQPTPRVLQIPGSPTTERQRVMVAVLDAMPAAFAFATTCAALWDVPGTRLVPVHVVRTVGRTGRRGGPAVMHEIAGLGPDHVTTIDAIPVVRPEIVVLHMCGSTYPQRAEAVLENLWRRRLVSGPSLRRTLDELAGSGRRGVIVLRDLLDERGDGYVPPASNLERRFASILSRAGEPSMRPQIDTGAERWVGRVDFRDERRPLVVEVQSAMYHSALVDQRRDAERITALRLSGFEVVEITDDQIWFHPDEVVETVRAARRRLDRS